MNKKAIITLVITFIVSVSASAQIDDTAGDRQYYDSAHFHIIIGKYTTGEKYLENHHNKLNSLESWKLFYKNGQVKEQGVMTHGNLIQVGIWKYYSASGELVKVINYDKKTPISYFKALKIAETKGYRMPHLEVSESTYKHRKYWQVDKWKENPDGNGATAETILIDKQTGKVVKPDFVSVMVF